MYAMQLSYVPINKTLFKQQTLHMFEHFATSYHGCLSDPRISIFESSTQYRAGMFLQYG